MESTEYEDDEREYRKQLGIVGLQMMRLSGIGDDYENYPSEEIEDVFQGRKTNSLVEVDNQFDTFVEAIAASQDQFAFNLVDRMKAATFKVRITNALSDLIEPLVSRLNISKEEIEGSNITRHHEIGMYLDKILQAVDNLDKSADSNRGWYLATKDFFRHPELYIGRAVVKGIVSTLKFGLGALIGFKKEKSDADRIVEAIEKQTEWHMNNSIDQSRGFFERLKAQGVLGMGIRGIANLGLRVAGVSKDKAQRQEDMRSQGKTVQRSIRGFLSDAIYKSDITKKGRLVKPEPPKDDKDKKDKKDTTVTPPSELVLVFDEDLFDLMRKQFSEHMRRVDISLDLQRSLVSDTKNIEFIFDQTSQLRGDKPSLSLVSDVGGGSQGVDKSLLEASVSRKESIQSLIENIEELRTSSEKNSEKTILEASVSRKESGQSLVENIGERRTSSENEKNIEKSLEREHMGRVESLLEASVSRKESIQSLIENIEERRTSYENEKNSEKSLEREKDVRRAMSSEKHDETLIELLKDQNSGIFSIVKNTKATKDEVRKTRLQAMWQSVIGFGASIVSGITGLLATAGTMVASLLPLKALGGIFAAVGAKIVAAVLGSRMPTTSAGKPPVVVGGGGSKPPVPVGSPSRKKSGIGLGKLTLGGVAGSLAVSAVGSQLEEGSKAKSSLNILEHVLTGASIGGTTAGIAGMGIGSWLTAPVGAIIGGVAGLGTGLYANYENLFSSPKKEDDAFSPVSDQLESIKAPDIGSGQSFKPQIPNNDTVASDVLTTITPVSSRLIAASEEIKNKAVIVGSSTAEFITEQSGALVPHFKAIEDGLAMQSDVIKETIEGLKKKTEESLSAVREGNKTSKEIVSVLKGILENTKQQATSATSPFSDVVDGGFLKNILGR